MFTLVAFVPAEVIVMRVSTGFILAVNNILESL